MVVGVNVDRSLCYCSNSFAARSIVARYPVADFCIEDLLETGQSEAHVERLLWVGDREFVVRETSR